MKRESLGTQRGREAHSSGHEDRQGQSGCRNMVVTMRNRNEIVVAETESTRTVEVSRDACVRRAIKTPHNPQTLKASPGRVCYAKTNLCTISQCIWMWGHVQCAYISILLHPPPCSPHTCLYNFPPGKRKKKRASVEPWLLAVCDEVRTGSGNTQPR